ncbi:MAG: ribose-phosphate pyrophosphokinase [Arenicellales bacterium]|jgi:ribose-phosphate pyrophosphokinase
MKLFALSSSRLFGEKVAAAIGTPLAPHEEREFEDGEHKARPLVSVRGEDVYVIQSLYGDPERSVNDKLCRLLFFLGAVREDGAGRVTAVVPYLAYARKDRQTKPRDPVTTRYMAQLLEAMAVDAVMTLETHNIVAFQNAFRCVSHHLDTRRLFASHLRAHRNGGPLVVASPDPGGVKRAQLFQEVLEAAIGRTVGFAFMDKRRSAGKVSGTLLMGDVESADVLVIDDLISTGGTMLRAAEACLGKGARTVRVLAAHGLFTAGAESVVTDSRIAGVVVTDTVPHFRLSAGAAQRVEVVSAAPLFAQAIQRCHEDGSLVELLEGAD